MVAVRGGGKHISTEIHTQQIKVQFVKLGLKKYSGRKELCGQILKEIEIILFSDRFMSSRAKIRETAKAKSKKQPV